MSAMQRLRWSVPIGADFADDEGDEYRQAVEQYILDERKKWLAQLTAKEQP